MTTQKKPVIRTSNINTAGVVVKPNNRKNHSFDYHGSYTFSVRVSVVPEVAPGQFYVGIISAFATSQDEAIRNIEKDLKEGYCEADSFVLRRFQPIGQDVYGDRLGLTSVYEFIEMFSLASRNLASIRFKSQVYNISDMQFVRCLTAA